MQFEPRLRRGIHDGSITLAFRRWRRCQVVAGRQYRTGTGLALAESVEVVEPSRITVSDALAAGYASVAELTADLRGDPQLPLYRIRFRPVDGPDPRDELASTATLDDADVTAIAARLARMDTASKRGPWTTSVLALIADQPGVVSTKLAEQISWERADFKLHVRHLKELGLTISLDVGYRISPRGASYLASRYHGARGQGTRAPATPESPDAASAAAQVL